MKTEHHRTKGDLRSSLQKVIARIESPSCASSQVRLLIAPPLSARMFRRQQQKFRWFLIGTNRYHEFVQRALAKGIDSKQYEKFVAARVLVDISMLRKQTDVIIKPDATFADFVETIQEEDCRALFLVAHHMSHVGRPSAQVKVPGIEFADGGWPWDAVEDCLSSLERSEPLSLIFLVCETEDIVKPWYPTWESLGGVAFVSWPAEFSGAVEIARMWISNLDGQRGLDEALRLVIDDITGGYNDRHSPND